MSRTNLTKNALAQAYADLAAKLSLHTGDPGTTGANDLGLTHSSITWGTPAAGVVLSTEATFAVVAGSAITHVGVWDSAGNFVDSFANNLTFADDTTYKPAIRFTETG